MQDLDRGIVIGQRTFGKGLVQTTRGLSYNANLKLTTAKYYIPSGRCIQALDYANRRSDGSVGHIPDSLTSEFRTRNGRIVKDGGGIVPDILVDQQQLSRMASNLVYSNHLFDFATKYRNTHPQIVQPADFSLTDEVYAELRDFLASQNFTYETASENALQSLIRSAKAEKYYESAQPLLAELEKNLSHNLDKDLKILRPEISMLLADEIIGRYYYQKGRIEYMLRDDNGLSGAIVLLKNPAEYNKVLTIK
jgi:carboxyl-terminal processing protease